MSSSDDSIRLEKIRICLNCQDWFYEDEQVYENSVGDVLYRDVSVRSCCCSTNSGFVNKPALVIDK